MSADGAGHGSLNNNISILGVHALANHRHHAARIPTQISVTDPMQTMNHFGVFFSRRKMNDFGSTNANTLLSGTTSGNLDRLRVAQNSLARVVCHASSVVISRPWSRDSNALEFILSRSRSLFRDLKTQISVLVSRQRAWCLRL